MSLPSFPRSVPTSGAALCSAGSLGSVPPLRRSYCGTPTSRRPDRARCLRPVVTGLHRSRRDLPGSWATLAYVPWPTIPLEPVRRGPGLCPASWRPGVAFRERKRVGLQNSQHFRDSIPRPACPLSTLHERPHGRPCKTRFRLATSTLAGRDSHPQAALRNFRSLHLPFRPGFPGALRSHWTGGPW
jgi:hypothetical protein